ncbi:ABC transporter substrate-binding protein [Bombilactobacillus folatiphilus]|uniref:ABC transporter substrate-binding protein n=1 Tax=Bombilactobacillus folatiphilus TaxID=2923362 RepID=A0ABY4PAW2_9LACO|nr:tryptophan ABC transporter substrate-binding protein [Bombilactobacillus folatiphilus]UQS82817.1 ABC transporter substrate-binding protein [Bombilactobacillus folatiphilus]
MKRMLTFITAIILFLGIAFVKMPAKDQTSAPVENTKVVHVGILQMVTHPALDQIHQGIISGLKAKGFVAGRNLKIDFLNAQGDQSNLKTMSQKLVNQDDLVFGIATPAAQALANSAKNKLPIILAGISAPASSGLVKTEQRPGGNITGSSGSYPVMGQLKLIQALLPQAHKIGIIYTSSDHGGQINAHAFEKVVRKAGLTPKMYTIANTNDLQQVATQMVSEVDAVYAPQDNGIASAMKTLVNVTNNAGIPVFPSAETMVPDGGSAAYAINQRDMGVLAGKMAGNVLHGKKPATYPISYVKKGHYIINQKQVRKLHLKIPADVMQQAKQTGRIIK